MTGRLVVDARLEVTQGLAYGVEYLEIPDAEIRWFESREAAEAFALVTPGVRVVVEPWTVVGVGPEAERYLAPALESERDVRALDVLRHAIDRAQSAIDDLEREALRATTQGDDMTIASTERTFQLSHGFDEVKFVVSLKIEVSSDAISDTRAIEREVDVGAIMHQLAGTAIPELYAEARRLRSELVPMATPGRTA